MPDNFTPDQLIPLLDSNMQNVIICGSVNEYFSNTLLKILDEAPASYRLVGMGMPTWDGLRSVNTTVNEDLDVIYSTPFNYGLSDKKLVPIIAAYKQKSKERPGDMFFKGYETMYCFSRLLAKYHNDFMNNLSDTSFNISNGYLFKPVKLSNEAVLPDYIENKKLFFIKLSQGVIKSVE